MLLSLPDGTPLWWYLTAMSVAVLLIGMGKSGFGIGLGVLTMPLVANALPAQRALGVILPLLILGDLFAVWTHRRHCSWAPLRWLIIGGVIGIALGTAVIWLFEKEGVLTTALNLTVGGVCLLFALVQGYRLLGGRVPNIPASPVVGIGAGTAAGVVSTITHSAGPIIVIYMLEQKLAKQVVVGTMVVYFLLGNSIKVPGYVWLDLINKQTLIESAVWAPLVALGAVVGIWMIRRIPQKPFTLIMYAIAAVSAARMMYLGLAYRST